MTTRRKHNPLAPRSLRPVTIEVDGKQWHCYAWGNVVVASLTAHGLKSVLGRTYKGTHGECLKAFSKRFFAVAAVDPLALRRQLLEVDAPTV